jgi:enamine deaminase RidA (YjgF/YER057c/UK114 family)
MPQRRYAWPAGHWDWYQHLAFKHGICAGELAFVGGQVDKSPAGDPLHAYDLTMQTAVVVRHIDTVLQKFGAGLADVVKLVAFYVTAGDVDEAALVADIGRHALAHGGAPHGAGPAITLVPLPCLALPGMMVEIEAIAMVAMDGKRLERTVANPSDLIPLPPPFSHGVRCGDHLWTSAQRSRLADGSLLHPHDLVAQTAIAVERVARVLGALGADLADVVKLSTWYRGDGTRATWEPAACKRVEYFPAPGPAISALPTPSLAHGDMTQVDAWAQ